VIKLNKRGQLTIFIIIAILIVAAAITIFLFRDKIFEPKVPSEFEDVYDFFDDCVEQKTLQGLEIAGVQAGYIDVPEFEPGSEYAPFSSQLDFLGSPVPYWYYVSGNNVIKEQVPSLPKIEQQLEDFIEEQIEFCDFDEFRKQGYLIETGKPRVDVNIRESKVDVEVKMSLVAEKQEAKSRIVERDIEVRSNFGKFYELAKEIYDKEKEEMFLENYGLDVMYNYAPVTGVEITCAPQIWNPQEVVDDLKLGLSANTMMLKTGKSKSEEYFTVDVDSNENVNFIYDPNWPTRIEIWPVENNVMMAEPVGLQQGMGIIGFCYVPYHFVYDIYYPVLIQVYDDDGFFQFPVAVVIDKSVARQALEGQILEEDNMGEFCNYKNTDVTVYTYDADLNPVEANIDFACMEQKCNMGQTVRSGGDAILSTAFPQCVNGKIIARAEGYVTASQYVSTNEPQDVDILMRKVYELDLDLDIDGRRVSDGLAVVNFNSEEYSTSVIYPEQDKVSLAEGDYEISVQVFGDASLTIPASSTRQCVEVPSSGLLGVFGKTREECFDIDIPSQTIDNALIAGGKVNEYILASELIGSRTIQISVDGLPRPTTLEKLQENYGLVETSSLGVIFR